MEAPPPSDDVAFLLARLRAALELVHDPCVARFKGPVHEPPSARMRESCLGLIRHVWGLVHEAYGVKAGHDFFAVHRPGDYLNCLALTCSEEAAQRIVQWWPGQAVVVSVVTSAELVPERYIPLAVALHWSAPPWLAKKK
jgi:hypothetical protein